MAAEIPTSFDTEVGKCPLNNAEVSESLNVTFLDLRVLNFVTLAFFQHGFKCNNLLAFGNDQPPSHQVSSLSHSHFKILKNPKD